MNQQTDRLEYGAKIVLYIVAALLPLWFVPVPIGVELGREITFGGLIVFGVILWILSVLARGEIRYQRSPILYAAALLLVVFAASSIISKTALTAPFWTDAIAEKLSTLVAGLLLMILAGGTLRSRKDAGKAVYVLIFSGIISAIITMLQMVFSVPVYSRLVAFAQGVDFNPIGTVNALALFYVMLLVMAVGLLSACGRSSERGSSCGRSPEGGSSAASGGRGKWARYVLIAAIPIFLIDLAAINFKTAWIVLLGSSMFVFGLTFRGIRSAGQNRERKGFGLNYSVTIGLIAVSIVMLLVRTQMIGPRNLQSEVSPTHGATLDVAKSVFREGPRAALFGSGPGTFGLDWSKYKNVSVNQTVFWNIRFNQGASWLTTLAATTGILGVFAYLLFLAIPFLLFLKRILNLGGFGTNGANEERDDSGNSGNAGLSLPTAAFLGLVALILSAFLYSASLSTVLLLFLMISVISVMLADGRAKEVADAARAGSEDGRNGNKESFWDIENATIRFEHPWTVFLSSLVIILFLSLGVAAMYFEVGRMRAAFAVQAGVEAFNKNDVDKSIAEFERAAGLEPSNFQHYQSLSQIHASKINDLIQRALKGENVQQSFQAEVSRAVNASQASVALNPQEPSVWRIQGRVYETIIPFIQGSERLAFDSYGRAADLDPLNPTAWIDLGRAKVAFADRLQTILSQQQISAADRAAAEQARAGALTDAMQAFQKAADVKPDFAAAHFLLAQTAIRMNNIQAAIKSAENARLAAPFDIGVAFQLGLLYYQNNNLDQAQAEFERTVSLDANYSNARYFLGLIYDKKGDKKNAMAQFEKVYAMNPENQEIKKIMENLQKGKGALEGVVPPAQPPERRKDTPVGEKSGETRNPR